MTGGSAAAVGATEEGVASLVEKSLVTTDIAGSVAHSAALLQAGLITAAEREKIVDFVKREMGKSKAQFHRDFNGKIYSAEELSALIFSFLMISADSSSAE